MEQKFTNAEVEAMSPGYWARWNEREQATIDRDIERYRKADGEFRPADLPAGTEVEVEQISSSFIFGAHIFNFDQLGSDACNAKYRELYGTLFNSATIAFYWKCFEPEEGATRFKGEFRDSAEFWRHVTEPKAEPHWRRPATDPVVEFCESRNIRLHGHVLVWGNRRWQIPEWLTEKLPSPWRERMREAGRDHSCYPDLWEHFSPEELARLLPEFTQTLNDAMTRRISEIALHYQGRLQSWDICNESAIDYKNGRQVPGAAICRSWYGLMPGDYTYRSFKIADAFFPPSVKFNINDYDMSEAYRDQTCELLKRGCRIDIMGAQMHLFDPQSCQDIADGKSDAQSPESVRRTMTMLSQANLPIHLSEITITSPGNDARGETIQAVLARNLYRLWFSQKQMMGITWWNVVDDCGAPGEPSVSGLYHRDMTPKKSAEMMHRLLLDEWRTRLTVKADAQGTVGFRGFRGNYHLRWHNAAGEAREEIVTLA